MGWQFYGRPALRSRGKLAQQKQFLCRSHGRLFSGILYCVRIGLSPGDISPSLCPSPLLLNAITNPFIRVTKSRFSSICACCTWNYVTILRTAIPSALRSGPVAAVWQIPRNPGF